MSLARTRDPEATRLAILDAAQTIFLAKGFAEASTSAVARRAGVTKSLIHHHFGSKEELWAAVKRRNFAGYFDAQKGILDTKENNLQLLRESLVGYFQFLAQNPDLVRMLSWMYLEKDDRCDDMAIELRKIGVEKLRESQRLGILRPDVTPEAVLISFLSLVEHWFLAKGHCTLAHPDLMQRLGGEGDLDQRYLDEMLKIFFQGVMPR